MKPLSAGQKDQLIRLQRRIPGTGRDAVGQAADAFADAVSVWAQAEPIRGRELFAAGQAQTEVEVRFRIDFREDVQTTWRVIWRNQPHDIVHVIDVQGRRTVLELMCSTGARDGR